MSTVFFATNRTATGPLTNADSYSTQIQPPSQVTGLIFGSAFVNGTDVAAHGFGEVQQIATAAVGMFSPENLPDLDNPGRHLLLFVHGFNTGFANALRTAAYNQAFLAAGGFDATIMVWSWPSLGEIIDGPILPDAYLRDQSVARLSGLHLMTLLENIEPIAAHVHASGKKTVLLVHSMGNLALESAVSQWFAHGNGNARLFDTALLCAADCPANAFAGPPVASLAGLPNLVTRTVIYYSNLDAVLQFSAAANLGQIRLGEHGPIGPSPANGGSIDASVFQDYQRNFLTSHEYYHLSPACRASLATQC